jgi:ubiquinone/menaquinone biosynthesis C-methylase UbiE
MSNWDTAAAEWYAKNYGEYGTNRLGIEAVTLTPTVTVVDIGCGTGCALRHAAKVVTQGQLIGIDPVPRMVEIALESTDIDRILFKVGSAENVPVESTSADVVLAFDSFDHWQDHLQGLSEIKRILKPKGQLVVIKDGGVPNGDKSRLSFIEKLANSGFSIETEKVVKDEDISFTIWICVANS